MSSEIEIEDAGSSAPDQFMEVAVTRGDPLSRYAVDTGLPIYLGRDFEIALLSYTVRLEAETTGPVAAGGRQEKSMRVCGELLELARVRIAPPGAREMAMAVLRQLLENGLLTGDALQHEISDMIGSIHPESGDGN